MLQFSLRRGGAGVIARGLHQLELDGGVSVPILSVFYIFASVSVLSICGGSWPIGHQQSPYGSMMCQ